MAKKSIKTNISFSFSALPISVCFASEAKSALVLNNFQVKAAMLV